MRRMIIETKAMHEKMMILRRRALSAPLLCDENNRPLLCLDIRGIFYNRTLLFFQAFNHNRSLEFSKKCWELKICVDYYGRI